MNMLILQELAMLLERQKPLGLVGIKSEFESEAVRHSEFTLLSCLAKSKQLYSALKIGGAEAKTDMFAAIENQSDYIIAPMIETQYAAKKCSNAYNKIIRNNGYQTPKLLVNIETLTAFNNCDYILDELMGTAIGIVFGRVDFTLSCEMKRSEIQSEFVKQKVLDIAQKCSERNLEFIVGGGISVDSIDFLLEVKEIRLDRFETRKCILDSSSLRKSTIYELLKDCVLFELLWLKYKSQHYSKISAEDNERIKMLEKRHLYNISGEN